MIIFRTRFFAILASVVRKKKAKTHLETQRNRQALNGRNDYSSIIHHTDPEMPVDKKLRLLMCGPKQELFVGLARKPLKSVQELVSEATTTEKTLNMRNHQYTSRCCSSPISQGSALPTCVESSERSCRKSCENSCLRPRLQWILLQTCAPRDPAIPGRS